MKRICITLCSVFLSVALLGLLSCKNEPKNGKLQSLNFTESEYTIAENDNSLNLRKKLVGTPEGIIDTAKISWQVSDEEIAQMDGAFVDPLKAGSVQITATVHGISAKCTVNITEVEVLSIKLDPVTVNVNEEAQLTYVTEPSGISIRRFTLVSSNENIATVTEDGVVKGVKEGSATITATCGDIKDVCTVTVKKVAVSEVTLSETTHTINQPTGSFTLTATVRPDNASYPAVTWKSSNPSVATVLGGQVTILKYGEADITATADGQSAVCKVKAAPILVTKINLNKKYYRFSSIGGTFTLSYTLEPSNATEYNITFSSSDPSVASVTSSGTVKCLKNGVASIICTDTRSGVSAKCPVAKVVTGTVTDCQGHTYPTVKIGDQWWMAENLRCTKYDTESPKYGGPIYSPTPNQYEPYVVTPDLSAATNMTSAQKEKAGLYYNWAAAVGTDDATSYAGGQGICPNGWRMPSKSDWATLRSTIQNLTGQEKIGAYLVSSSGWNEGNKYGGYDLFGFNGLPVGYYNNYQSGQTLSAGTSCLFWSSGKYNQASYLGYDAYYTDIWGGSDGGTIQENIHKACYHGLPVRCIKQ